MDPDAKKKALRMFTCGLYVVTAKHEAEVAAGTVTWLSQASFSPPLIMTAIRGDSHLHRVLEQSRSFAVSVVSESQKEMAEAFFRASQIEDGKINGFAVETGQETGAPLVADAPAWVEARVTESVSRGDHTVFVAEVVGAGVRDQNARALVLSDTPWTYGG